MDHKKKDGSRVFGGYDFRPPYPRSAVWAMSDAKSRSTTGRSWTTGRPADHLPPGGSRSTRSAELRPPGQRPSAEPRHPLALAFLAGLPEGFGPMGNPTDFAERSACRCASPELSRRPRQRAFRPTPPDARTGPHDPPSGRFLLPMFWGKAVHILGNSQGPGL